MTIELLNMDCMDYMKGCEDNSFDLAIVDPPYGRGEDGGTNRNHGVTQKNGSVLLCTDGGYKKKDWDKTPPSNEYFIELERISKHKIIWGMNYYDFITGHRSKNKRPSELLGTHWAVVISHPPFALEW